MPVPFHLAFPVRDLGATRAFYADVLGARVGRETDHWIDLDFFGHQLSGHLADPPPDTLTSEVDGHRVPLRHFGVVLPWADWHALADRLAAAGVPFAYGPTVRFVGRPGEQATLFVVDPSGNALEFKAFQDPEQLFAT